MTTLYEYENVISSYTEFTVQSSNQNAMSIATQVKNENTSIATQPFHLMV